MVAVPVPSFTVVRLREGYDIAEVDTFLAVTARELQGRLPDPALAQRIREVRFTPVRLRRGYDMRGVDRHLDVLEAIATRGHA